MQLFFDRFATSLCDSGLNEASSTTPSLTPCTVRVSEATTGSEITARVIRTVRVVAWAGGVGPDEAAPRAQAAGWRGVAAPLPGRSIPSATSVPGGPLISAVAASAESPASLRPLTATISSPAFSPARSAGEVSNTRAIADPCVRG